FAESAARRRLRKSRQGADYSCLRLIPQSVFCTGINPDLVHLFFPFCPKNGFYPETAPGNLHMSQAVSLLISGYLKYLSGKRIGILRHLCKLFQSSEQVLHPGKLQRRTKIAGKYLSLADQT